jgi:hypothetical protein
VLAELVAALREQTAVTRELSVEIKALRAEQRRRAPAAVPALIGAIEEVFGSTARFTVGTIMQAVDENPHGAIAEAVGLVIARDC